MPERHFPRRIRVGLATSVLALALLVGSVSSLVSHAAWRPRLPLGLDLYMPVPEDNPLTREKVELGRQLFSDPILSRDQRLACAGCHEPERAFTDGRTVSRGVFGRQGTRHVPTLINRGYGRAFFWDGRISSLEEQVLQPIQDPKEMDMTLEEVLQRLKQDGEYHMRFRTVFGREITTDDLGRALASYVRTILSGNAAVDRYDSGEREALSHQARQGLGIFRGKGNCWVCHFGPTFTDERFHNTGVAWKRPQPLPSAKARGSRERGPASAEGSGALLDQGRYMVTGKEEDRGAFKVPTLREVARTAPYMHDGSLATLEEVIDFYDRGGNANPYLDAELHPLNLTATEKQAVVTFLHALSGRVQDGIPSR